MTSSVSPSALISVPRRPMNCSASNSRTPRSASLPPPLWTPTRSSMTRISPSSRPCRPHSRTLSLPIVYATQGFLNLTGYTLDQVLGRNCRFLQGPETDPKAVEKIRRSIEEGSDMSVCLLNYRVDGSTFWNQFFIAALRDASGNITNYVGVQCKVSDQYAANVCKKQEEDEDEEQDE